MAEVARKRAVALRKSLKEYKYMHTRKPSLDDAEAFVLGALLLDEEPKQRNNPNTLDNNEKPEDNPQDDEEKRKLSTEILFSLPPAETLTGQRAELPPHHKPAKRFSVKALWHAHEQGYHASALVRQSRKLSATTEEEPLLGRDVSTGGFTTTDDDDDDDDVASDVEVRPDSKSDASAASSWDENDHRDNYDTWEVCICTAHVRTQCCGFCCWWWCFKILRLEKLTRYLCL